MNKLDRFFGHPFIRQSFDVAPGVKAISAIWMRRLMDANGILLVDLSEGLLGEEKASLMGSLIVSMAWQAAISRADVESSKRSYFTLYIDEFQRFTTLKLASMLSEARKYGVSLVLAHQYLEQIDPLIQKAILGNVGTLLAFRLQAEDAEMLGKEFFDGRAKDLERWTARLEDLEPFHFYCKFAGMEPLRARTVKP